MSGSELINAADRILSLRHTTIENLLNVVYNAISLYVDCREILCTQNKEACHDVALGSLIRNAKKIGLWPQKDAKDIHISVETLARQIQGFAIQTHHPEGNCFGFRVNIQQEVTAILQNVPSHVGDSEREHMEQQRKKLEDRH